MIRLISCIPFKVHLLFCFQHGITYHGVSTSEDCSNVPVCTKNLLNAAVILCIVSMNRKGQQAFVQQYIIHIHITT